MKKALCILVVGMMAAAANAAVTGVWAVEEGVSTGLNRLTLTVTSTEGNITGFDIAAYTVSDVLNQTAGVFSPTVNLDTHFLFQTSHTITNPTPPPPTKTITDLTYTADDEGTSYIQAAFSFTAGGVYEGGAASYAVLQLVVSDSFDPMDLQMYNSTWTAGPKAKIGSGGGAYLSDITIVPEPVTMTLLGLGGLGLMLRRRK